MSVIELPAVDAAIEIGFGGVPMVLELGESSSEAARLLGQIETIVNDFDATGTRAWYMSPSVTGATAGTGTFSNPFSPEHAFAGGSGAIKPGHVVWMRGQRPGGTAVPNYRPYTTAGLARDAGYTLSCSGEPDKFIKFKNYPGELVTFSDPIDTSAGWTKVTTREDGITPIDPSCNVYESNFTVSGTTNFVSAYYAQAGDFHVIAALRGPTGAGPYTTSTNIAAMYATSSRFRMDGNFYPGPCIIRLGNGKLRIRLDACYVEQHEGGVVANPFFGETSQVYPALNVPGSIDLRIYRENDQCIRITGDWIEFDGGNRTDHKIVFDGFLRGAIRDQGNNNRVKGCLIRSPYIPLNIGTTTATVAGVYEECTIDGMLDPLKSPFAWLDVKGGSELLVNNRVHAISVSELASNGKLRASTIRRAYDGLVFSSQGWQIGGIAAEIDGINALSAAGRALARWAQRNTIGVWDDGLQIYSRAQGLNLGFNAFLGAGPSRDGASSGTAWGANKVKVHHNVIDTTAGLVMWGRRGRDYATLAEGSEAKTTISGSFSDSATVITVANGAAFTGLSLPRNMTILEGRAPWRRETVQVTGITGNDLTIVRGRTPTAGTPDTAIVLQTGDIIVNLVRDVRSTEEGRWAPNAIPTHGVPTGSQRRYSWDFFHNTVIVGPSITGLPNQAVTVLQFGTDATNTEIGNPKNLCFNNVFLAGGLYQATAPTTDPRTMWLTTTRTYYGRGDNIHDGNAYIGTAGYSLTLLQLASDSLGSIASNSINTIAEFRTAQLLADAANFAGYPAGMESTGLAYTATTASQIGLTYQPIDARLLSGAIPLATYGLPGTEMYEPWRGALPPLGLT